MGVQSASAKCPFKRPAAPSSAWRISLYAFTSPRESGAIWRKVTPALIVGKGFKEVLERGEAFHQPLAVVEPVHADDELAAEQARGHALHLVLRHRRLGGRNHRIHVDSYRVNADPHAAPSDLDDALLADRRGSGCSMHDRKERRSSSV